MDYVNWINWINLTNLTGVALFGLLSYKSYTFGKKYLYEYILKRVKEELDRRLKEEEEQEFFKPIHQNSAVIKVQHAGASHSVYIPYNRRKSSAMLRKKVYLIKGEEKIDISQKPGIPYLVNAQQLGGESIQVEDLEGNVVHTFLENEVPDCF